MTRAAYYNEFDPYAAQWLRNLIAAGHIAPGEVDERSIADVQPDELSGFAQCHFFAGIGVWSYALRCAGWSDDRPVWTGSCPCQPFSPAGRGEGFADERHLWPAWHHLISQCRPPVVFGEQVDGKPAAAWLDLVHSDLEAAGYAFGALVFPAASIGAPHRRHRTYFVANAGSSGAGRHAGTVPRAQGEGKSERFLNRRQPDSDIDGGAVGGLADNDESGQRVEWSLRLRREHLHDADGRRENDGLVGIGHNFHRPGPTNGFWRDPDWLFCRDRKWRPVEPGTSPLAHGAAARVGRLRAYGNAIVAPQAEAFIRAYAECRP